MTHSTVRSPSPVWRHAAWLALAFSMPLFSTGEAAAAEGCTEPCPKGFTCEEGLGACPAIACAEGQECPPCNPEPVYYCAPAACTSNDQCGDDQVCAEQVTYDCESVPEPACPPGAECAPAKREPANCTPVTHSYCTPRWQLPCTVAADCGAGFDCVPQERCGVDGSPGSGSTGSGSAGTATPGATPTSPTPGSAPAAPPSSASPVPPSNGDAVPPAPAGEERAPLPSPPPSPVTCEPAGYSACVPIQVACATDADCVAGWTCVDNPNGVCWSGPDGVGGCTPADPPKVCQPPYAGGIPGGVGEGTPATGVPGSGPTVPPTVPGAEPAPAPGEPTRGNDSGSAATPVPANPASNESANNDSNASEGGCSVSAAPATASGFAWLALGLAGMFGVRRRRR
jgi:MYXO-CTERM domain-containing protein